METTKTCTICNQTKDIKLFRIDKTKRDSHRSQCKNCIRVRKLIIGNTDVEELYWKENNRYHKLKTNVELAQSKDISVAQYHVIKRSIKSIKKDMTDLKATRKKLISLIDKENKRMISAYKKFCNSCSTEKYKEEFFKGQCRCKECDRAKTKAYESNNADKIREQKAVAHQRRMKDPTNKAEAIARYSAARHKRRANKNTNTVNSATPKQIRELIKNSNNKCYWCGCNTKKNGQHIDHYIPLSKSGGNEIDNLVVSCAFCNISKGAKSPYEFANKLGRLL